MTLRIGVLGASRIAEVAIVEPARQLGFRLVAVAARDRDRAGVFAEKCGVERVLDSYADVVNDPEVDAVYNPLANALHAPWNLAAVEAGKPVLTEKPFARNRVEAQCVHDAAVAAGVTVMEGFHYLFHPVTQRIFEVATSGELGELRHVEVAMAMPEPDASDPRWSLPLAGGALMDLGCYGLHIMRMIGNRIGAAPTITGAQASQRSPGIDERCDVSLLFANGVTGRSTNSMVAQRYSFSIKVVGTSGEALVHDFIRPYGDDRVTIRAAGNSRTERLGTLSTYTYQLEAFAAHVIDGAQLPLDAADAVENMDYVDAAYRAAGMSPR
jgi:predicted dehydrogenase